MHSICKEIIVDTILHVPEELRATLEALALRGYPDETCGLLIGQMRNSACHVVSQRVARNLSIERSQDRFVLDPQDYLAAEEEAKSAGLSLVGIWHTHPDHPAKPSATDLEFAWEGWSYIILSVAADGVNEFRSWRLENNQFIEEEVRYD